jgi:hypothetical protein
MNFALLGIDDDVLALARAIAATDEHAIVSLFEGGHYASAIRDLAPMVATDQEWESLLLEDVVDCVIVGRSAPEDVRADQLRKLVQAKVPLIVVHPTCEAIVGYEIEMIRRDVDATIIPYYPLIAHPIVDRLRSLAETPRTSGTTLEQITFERRQADRSRAAVMMQLARDSEIARRMLGSITKVGAFGALAHDRPTSLAVQMTNPAGEFVRWSVEAAPDETTALIRLAVDGKQVACELTQDKALLRLNDLPESTPNVDSARLLIDQLPAILRREQSPPATWMDCCRAQEIVDTVPRCLARGKTIELYNEEHTEEGAFKGVMAVGGCLILMIGLLMVVFVAVVEGLQLPLHRFSLWSNWPLYICSAFFFFLLLQFFRFAARRSS